MLIHDVRDQSAPMVGQWTGRTEDRRPVYVRYKWNNLSVHLGPAGAASESAADPRLNERWGEEVYVEDADPYQIEWERVEALTGLRKAA